jgi:hypothetical protein
MTKAELARQIVKLMPGAPARTLARRLRQDYPQVFDSIENARKAVLYAVGRNGTKNQRGAAANADLFREPRKSGAKLSCPPSFAEPWVPVELPTPGVVLSISDLHVPYHDKRAIEVAVAFAKKHHKITDLVINGDYGDFYRISRYQKNPLARSLSEELRVQKEGLAWLAGIFKKQRKWFKLGNHDVRWDHWVWLHAPEMSDCEHMQLHEILHFNEHGYYRVDDQPIMAGLLPMMHGHELGHGVTSPVNPARGAFTRTNESIIVAHHHRTSTHAESDMWHKETATWSQGCLCDMRPEYARINKWNQGFAVIETAADGTYNVSNYRIGTDYTVRQS